MFSKIKLVAVVFSLLGSSLWSQSITVQAEDYKQQFEGAGTSIGLFIYHHFSMSPENQDQALRWINKDLHMTFIQDYIGKYPDDPEDTRYYDIRADYIKGAEAYRPERKISMNFDNFPDDLRTEIMVNGEARRILDFERPTIYDDLASWYFQALKAFQDRGVEVDILNVCNEPDWQRKYHFGFGDSKKGVAFILKEAIPKLKAMLDDETINTTSIKTPLIMAPNTLSTRACVNHIRYYKQNYPDAWDQVDIVSTHQYGGGLDITAFQDIQAELDGRILYQSEMHADHSDNLGLGDAVERPHRTALGLSALFNTAVNNGTQAWYYFENNYPNKFHPGGLIHVPWAGTPNPYKHYYAFKQLTSTQPVNSHVLNYSTSGIENNEVSVFRKMDTDSIYLNVSNFAANSKDVTITFRESDNTEYLITSAQTTSTDELLNAETEPMEVFSEPMVSYTKTLAPYSVNTITFAITSSAILAVDSQDSLKDFTVFSTNNGITIVPIQGQMIAQVELFSLLGNRINSYKNVSNRTTRIENLQPGVYIAKIKDKTGKLSTQKILHR